jgi:MoaA/NifB/PqqE/SkfB family radical SAM enzyme
MKLSTIFSIGMKNLEQAYYKFRGLNHKVVPYKLLIEVTTLCNSMCLYCDIWKIKKEDVQHINLNSLESFLAKMDKHLLWLALSGGEITNYSQTKELVQLIKKNSPKLRILTFTTNGLLPQRVLELARLMRTEIGCDIFITISLDGDKETHDSIRGKKGNYEKCMETYALLKNEKFDCHFGITVADRNHNFIVSNYKYYKDKIKAVTLFHSGGIFLTEQAENAEDANNKLTEAYKTVYTYYSPKNLGEWLVKFYLKLGVHFLKQKRETNIIPCDVGQSSAHLMANGDLKPCMYLPPIKNIGENFELSDYHNEQAQKLLDEIKKDKCPHCWMSCYGPHNMLQAPLQTAKTLIKSIE